MTIKMRSAAFPRRTFLERLGLGAGAALLAPIAQTLVSEAQGAVPQRKRVVLFLCGNGISPEMNFTPPELRKGDDLSFPTLDGPKAFTWPAMLAPLAPFRSRMLLVDGLTNRAASGGLSHSVGYQALSCVGGPNGRSSEEMPGGITIDQVLARTLGNDTRRRSVLWGVNSRKVPQNRRVFASGAEKPEAHVMDPSQLFRDLFGALATDAGGVLTGLVRQKKLIDAVAGDITRLQGALAGTERRKLEGYLQALEEFDRRENAPVSASCNVSRTPSAEVTFQGSTEDKLEAMNEMATLALVCGITPVVGASCGTGNPHSYFPNWKRACVGTPFEASGIVGESIGHTGAAVQGPAMDIIHGFNAALMARTVRALMAIPEGNGTAFDNTVMVYMSDNAEAHHATHQRWPLVVIGNAGGKLKSDGRFLRYPKRGSAGSRSMADFFLTLAAACDVPADDFGRGGPDPVKGPLGEILA